MSYPLPLRIIEGGEKATYNADINYSSAEPGEPYILVPSIDNKLIETISLYFIATKNEAGVNQIVDVADNILMVYDKSNSKLVVKGGMFVEVYNLNGMKVASGVSYNGDDVVLDLSGLGKGVMVVNASDSHGKRKSVKIAL